MSKKEYITCYDCAYRGDFVENPREGELPPFVDARYVRIWVKCHCPVPFYTRGLLVPYIMYKVNQYEQFEIVVEPLQHYCDKYMKSDICPECGHPMIALNSFGCSDCGYVVPDDFIKESELEL